MVSTSDLLKILLVVQFAVLFAFSAPANNEDSGYYNGVSDNVKNHKINNRINNWIISQYVEDYNGEFIVKPSGFWPLSPYQQYRNYPSHREQAKVFMMAPTKRNSELVNFSFLCGVKNVYLNFIFSICSIFNLDKFASWFAQKHGCGWKVKKL
jgi:hypothetical protein